MLVILRARIFRVLFVLCTVLVAGVSLAARGRHFDRRLREH
ncbi:MAG: hypothetical protein ABID87_05985 [Chloroflexota bacterium]